jgi:hypothetical protein
MERHYGKARHAEAIAVASSRVGDAASCAMYGGRFETTAVGSVIGDVTEYDLNSAYPAAMADLPCLVHGRWARTRTNHGPIAVSHLSFRHDVGDGPGVCHPLPVRRRTGELFYPREGRGWYWRAEYDRPGLEVTADVTYSWRPDGCECRPFAWVAFKSRGMPRKVMAEHAVGLSVAAMMGSPYTLAHTVFVGVRVALALGRPEDAGQWIRPHREIATRTTSKRIGGTWVDDGSGAVCWTDPAPPLLDARGDLQESYWRQFAMAAREEAALADLWSDDLPTWDE